MSRPSNFWSRRIAGVEAEQKAEVAAVEAEALAEQHAALDEKSDAELLEELNLPDPDTMVEGDDFSVFMSKTIPERLRKRALRKLWLSNPVLANVDNLVDYGEDFTDAATVFPDMQTTYQVGKGMLKHVQEMARQAEEKLNPPEEDTHEGEDVLMADADETHDAQGFALEDSEQNDGLAEQVTNETPVDAADDTTDNTTDDEGVVVHAATPRRMKFRVEETAA